MEANLCLAGLGREVIANSRQQGVEPDCQQLGSIDLGCHLAAYFEGRIGSGQHCCRPLSASPLGGSPKIRR